MPKRDRANHEDPTAPDLPFTTPYPRPSTFSDPHGDWIGMQAELNQIREKRGQDLTSQDFRRMYQAHLPAADYVEGVFFLPWAFRYLHNNPDGAHDCIQDVVWFATEHADELKQDRLLDPVRDAIRWCLRDWTQSFQVIHFDQEACKAKGWGNFYFDLVENSDLVFSMIEELVHFENLAHAERHADLADEFVESLAARKNAPINSAWFLELMRSHYQGEHRLKRPRILVLMDDRSLCEYHAGVVRKSLVDSTPSPTYWNDVFLFM